MLAVACITAPEHAIAGLYLLFGHDVAVIVVGSDAIVGVRDERSLCPPCLTFVLGHVGNMHYRLAACGAVQLRTGFDNTALSMVLWYGDVTVVALVHKGESAIVGVPGNRHRMSLRPDCFLCRIWDISRFCLPPADLWASAVP